MITLNELLERTKEMVQQIGDHLHPDGDWVPTLLGWGDGGPVIVMFEGIDKERWPDLFREIASQTGLQYAVLVLSSWGVTLEPGASMPVITGQLHVRDHPDRREVLVLEGSDGVRNVMWTSEIERHETSHPTLGEWQKSEEPGGRVVEALASAIVAAQKEVPWKQ